MLAPEQTRLLKKAHSGASGVRRHSPDLMCRVNAQLSTSTNKSDPSPASVLSAPPPMAGSAPLTMSSHWCTATATCVPRGFVSTSTSPGTALSGLKKRAWQFSVIKEVNSLSMEQKKEKADKSSRAFAKHLNLNQPPQGSRTFFATCY